MLFRSYAWPNVSEACRMIGARDSEELRKRLLNEAGVAVLAAGALMVPQGLGSLLARPTSGRLTDTLGSRTVALAGVLIMLGKDLAGTFLADIQANG